MSEQAALEQGSDQRECMSIPLAAGEQEAPGRVLIAPWGEVKSSNGDFVVDEAAARLVLEAFAEQGTDLPVDYEHQSLGGTYASPNGQAPAAGWIRGISLQPPTDGEEERPGLYAEVEWTESAREKLAAREYRYLSPVVIVRKKDRRVVALHSAALTNKPAIVGMRPIVNRQERPVCAGPLQEAFETLCHRLSLERNSSLEMVLRTAHERIEAMTQRLAERDADEQVAAAMREGKLLPSQRQWAQSLAMKDAEGFAEWARQAPQVVVPGKTSPPDGGEAGGRQAVIASARAAFRAEPALAMLTNEEAWIRHALREAGTSGSAQGADG